MKERGKAVYIDEGEDEVDRDRKTKGRIERGQLSGEKLEEMKDLKEREKRMQKQTVKRWYVDGERKIKSSVDGRGGRRGG